MVIPTVCDCGITIDKNIHVQANLYGIFSPKLRQHEKRIIDQAKFSARFKTSILFSGMREYGFILRIDSAKLR